VIWEHSALVTVGGCEGVVFSSGSFELVRRIGFSSIYLYPHEYDDGDLNV
jgi:hypothetical protein